MHINIYKLKYFILVVLILFAGITNDILSIHIVKKMSIVEIVLILMTIYYFMIKRKVKVTLLIKYLLLLSAAFFFSSFYTSDYLPGNTFVVSPGLFTSYETRSYMSSFQFLYLVILTITFSTFLYNTKISKYKLEKSIAIATTIFSIFGLVFYISNILGINIPLIQSNDLSYSMYRLYSFGLEPQYSALFIIPGVMISYFNKWYILLCINLIALILTFSTSVLLGFIVAIILYNFKNVKFTYQLLLLPFVFLFIYMFYELAGGKILSFISVLSGDNDGTVDARALSIITAIDLLNEYWMGGVGWGNFSFYFSWRNEERIFNLGNIFLRILVEGGLFSLLVSIFLSRYIYNYTKVLKNAYFLILITFFIYFMANSTMFLMMCFWIYLIIFEYLSKKEVYVKRN